MTKEQAKEKIQKLIERYNALTLQEIKAMNEENTKNKFIRPKFNLINGLTPSDPLKYFLFF